MTDAPEEYSPLGPDDLVSYLEVSEGESKNVAEAQRAWRVAVALVDNFCLDAGATVPQVILDQCYILTGAESFQRRQSPGGVTQFADGTANPIRLAKDPMTPAYALLTPFVGLGIG